MLWNDLDHSFCESKILGLPEYINSFTSLFISFFGIYGLQNKNNDIFVDIMYSTISILGIGSFGYHYTGTIGWALCDEVPMIVAVFIGIIYTEKVYNKIKKNKLILDSEETYLINLSSSNGNFRSLNGLMIDIFPSNSVLLHDMKNSIINYYPKSNILIHVFLMMFFIICNTMSNYRNLFPYFFASIVFYLFYKIEKIFDVLYLSNCTSEMKITRLPYLVELRRRECHEGIQKSYNAMLTIIISCLIWVSTEISCNYIKLNILLIGHPMWHFFIGHGFYNLIQSIFYIKLNYSKKNIGKKYLIEYNKLYLLDIKELDKKYV